MLLTITNHTPSHISIGGRVGNIRANTSSEVEVTIAELEALRGRLTSLNTSGLISWSCGPSTLNEADDAAEGATVGYVDSSTAFATFTSDSVSVFVATGGNDVAGDGTQTNPYATVARALQDRQNLAAYGIAFRVHVVAPYTGPGFSYESPVAAIENTDFGTSQLQPPAVTVGAYYESSMAGVSDPRFTVEVGPITASAVSIVNTMFVAYTVPTGSFTAAHIGKVIRVFRAGNEVGRATLAHIVTGGTDVVYLSHSRSTGPTAVWSPAIGDSLYACENTVVFTSPIRLSAGKRAIFVLYGCTVQVLGSAFSNDYSVSLLSGDTYMANVRILNTSTARDEGLFIKEGASAHCRYVPSTVVPWMDATERAFTFMAAGFITANALSTDYSVIVRGAMYLTGWVLDFKVGVLTGGFIATTGLWFRGQLFVGVGSQLSPEAPCVFGGNRATPYPQPPLLVDGTNVGNEHGHSIAFMVDTAGYAAAQPMCHVKKSRFTSSLSFNGIGGAVTISSPVTKVDDFSNVVTAAGNITNVTPGQDVQAGTTFAAFAGLPIVDAPTLTRIATT